MKITSRRAVLKADDVSIFEESNGPVNIEGQLVPSGMNNPLVVVVFVMIAGHLLLI